MIETIGDFVIASGITFVIVVLLGIPFDIWDKPKQGSVSQE